MDPEIIEHEGIVECVERGAVRVRITSRSACGACKARQACGMAESQEKIVVVVTDRAQEYLPGEAVLVGVRKRPGASLSFWRMAVRSSFCWRPWWWRSSSAEPVTVWGWWQRWAAW